MTTENPFGDWQFGRLDPGQPMPLNILVQAAISGTVDDQITEHGENLFESLADRGPDAWRETALLLVQYTVSGSPSLGAGPAAAEQYLANQPINDATPALTTMHRAIAGAVANGTDGAAKVLAAATPDQVSGATRYLFALACLSSGYPKTRTEELMNAFCSGVR